MLWFDRYDRQARAAPGLLSLLPLAVVGVVVGLRENPVVSALIGLVVAAGGPLVLAGVVRTLGLNVQQRLYEKWGAAPTTALLRANESSGNRALREQRRAAVQKLTGVVLSSPAEEERDKARAIELAEAAVTVLREKTRDSAKFVLVAAENRTYGFERNMLGVRQIGLAVGGGSACFLGVMLLLVAVHSIHNAALELVIGLVVCGAMTVLWYLYPSERRVRPAAEKYAASLLDAASL